MLIGYFRKLQPFTPVLLFLVGAALWAEVFLEPEPIFFFHTKNPSPFYGMIQPFLASYPLASWIGAYLFLYIQALFINQILTSQGILDRYSFFTSLIYIILMSSGRGLLYMHPVLFANFFLLIMLNKAFKAYDEKEVMLEVYNGGLLIAIAGLFYLQAWLFFAFLVISLFIFYLIGIRSFLAAVLGFLTPFLFYFVSLFLFDKLDDPLAEMMLYVGWFGVAIDSLPGLTTALIGYLGGIVLIAFFHLVFLYLPDKPIRLRKRLWVLVYFSLISAVTFLFVPDFNPYHMGMLYMPFSAVLAGFFHQIDRKIIAEVLFTILLGLVIAGKLAPLL